MLSCYFNWRNTYIHTYIPIQNAFPCLSLSFETADRVKILKEIKKLKSSKVTQESNIP